MLKMGLNTKHAKLTEAECFYFYIRNSQPYIGLCSIHFTMRLQNEYGKKEFSYDEMGVLVLYISEMEIRMGLLIVLKFL